MILEAQILGLRGLADLASPKSCDLESLTCGAFICRVHISITQSHIKLERIKLAIPADFRASARIAVRY